MRELTAGYMTYYNKEETRSDRENIQKPACRILRNEENATAGNSGKLKGSNGVMQTDRKEALRYLGLGKHEPDPETERLLEECIRETEKAADLRHLIREYPLTIEDDGTIDGGCFRVKSANLKKNLSGCDSVLVMAVTVGAEVDRLLARYGKLSVAKAVVMQAVAAAMVEAYCNELNAMWKKEYLEKGLYLRPRFSPGYGDFPLSAQKQILDGLEAGKRIGITLTEGFLMLPSKSVTAVIGVSRAPAACVIEGCEACRKKDCAFRR